MVGTAKPPRQFHIRVSDEVAAAVIKRADAMGLSRDEWLTRAVVHALMHAEQNGEPKPLRLPWSELL